MVWRPMTPADLPAVSAIAATVHAAFPERDAVFAERLALYPGGCLLLQDGDDAAAGYAVSHPWHFAQPPMLDTLITAIPSPASTYYIHDVALLPHSRGSGAGATIASLLLRQAIAAGLDNLSLVAVNNSVAFWHRQGFAVSNDGALAQRLTSYGTDACYMVRAAIGND